MSFACDPHLGLNLLLQDIYILRARIRQLARTLPPSQLAGRSSLLGRAFLAFAPARPRGVTLLPSPPERAKT